VPVYRWALPEDLGPLRSGITAIVEGTIDVALFTTATQVTHLFEVAGQMGVAPEVQQRLARVVVASIGPTTTEELREHGLTPDVEAAPPKMGVLAREAAAQSEAVLSRKRS
jgi:uroporphyrinogen-III synthase